MGATNKAQTQTISVEDLETRFEGRGVFIEIIEDAETEDYVRVTNCHQDELTIFANRVTEDEIELPVRFATLINLASYAGAINERDVKSDFDGAKDISDFAYGIARNML